MTMQYRDIQIKIMRTISAASSCAPINYIYDYDNPDIQTFNPTKMPIVNVAFVKSDMEPYIGGTAKHKINYEVRLYDRTLPSETSTVNTKLIWFKNSTTETCRNNLYQTLKNTTLSNYVTNCKIKGMEKINTDDITIEIFGINLEVLVMG